MAINTRIQTRRDTAANWEAKNPVLLEGELIIVTTNAGDTRFKIGDGIKTYTQLPFQDESLYNALSGKADAVDLDALQSELDTKADSEHTHNEMLTVVNKTAVLPLSMKWTSVAYGDGKFVAAAVSSSIAAYSEDGIVWSRTTLQAAPVWNKVTYGNGKFVAVGSSSSFNIAYSEDGITWIPTTMPADVLWQSVTYGNGKFVAVSGGSVTESDVAAYSEDGITWIQITMPASAHWSSVTYGDGKFVAVTSGSDTDIAAYSEDGITWTQTTMPVSANWDSVTYGNGKFVAIALTYSGSNIAAYSEDGITWTQTTMPISGEWKSATYGDGKFVAVAAGSNVAAYSEDGITWTQTTMTADAYWTSVTYGNGMFIAVASESDIVACSIDGINWTRGIFGLFNPDGTDVTVDVESVLSGKQDKLIFDTEPTADSTNPVTSGGVKAALNWDNLANKPFGEEAAVIVKDKTMTFDSDMALVQEGGILSLVEGKTYIVTWAGVDYECEAISATVSGVPVIGVGNLVMAGGEDNGLPFGLADCPSYDFTAYGANTAGTYTFSISETTIKKIDNKYIDAEWMAKSEVKETVVFVEETTVTNNTLLAEGMDTVLTGTEYTVIFDGVEYLCPLRESKLAGVYPIKMLGNQTAAEQTVEDPGSNGEPFCLYFAFGSGSNLDGKLYVNTIDKNGEHTVSLLEQGYEKVDKLPERYLPDTVALKTDLDGKANVADLDAKADAEHSHDQYLTEIPDEYVTESELTAKGYLTEIPGTVALKTDLDGKANVADMDAKADAEHTHDQYLTEIPDEYVTESELTAKGYLTAVPEEYVTESELTAKGYLTAIPDTVAMKTDLEAIQSDLDAKADSEHTHDQYLTAIPDTVALKTDLDTKADSEHTHDEMLTVVSKTAAMPVSGQWYSSTYGNGKFVAVINYSDIAAYSEDGVTWNQTRMPVNKGWKPVTYGNGKFVAVVYNSDIAAYSEDGITWTQTTMPISAKWETVTYGNGKFVALTYGSDIAAYSEDGVTWTQTTMPTSANWPRVTYGNGKFVATSGDDTAIYSEDGIAWTQTTMPTSANWYSVTYGNGKFVAISYNNTEAAYSEDGITWIQTTMPSVNSWTHVTYGNGKFVMVGEYTDVAFYSEDGITWKQIAMPANARWYSVTYGNGKFVAITYSSDIAAYSTDGITWKREFAALRNPDGTDVTVSVEDALNGKQDTLTFDTEPTADSTNPVTSGGVKAAIDAIQSELDTKADTEHTHSWDTLENRPFGDMPTGGDTLTMDMEWGDFLATNPPNVFDGEFARVTDVVLTGEDLYRRFNIYDGGGNGMSDGFIMGGEESTAMFNDIGVGNFCEAVVNIPTDNYEHPYFGVTFPKAGIYFRPDVTKFQLEGYTGFPFIKSLDAKFLALNIGNGSAEGSVRTVGTRVDTGEYAFAEGFDTQATGEASHAEGYGATTASGDYGSHAEGAGTTASGDYGSHAEGAGTIASGTSSHAEGNSTIAASDDQHAQGKWNIEDSADKYAHIVGNGRNSANRSNAHTVDWDGLGWFAGGLKVGGTGQDDEAAQEVALKSDISTLQSNLDTKADADAVSTATNLVNGSAEGSVRMVSTAEEINVYAFAEGAGTTASGPLSHAEGEETTASGEVSHAEGSRTTASGSYSHAEGWETIASGQNSHAEGYTTNAGGWSSHAEGDRTIAASDNQHVQGKCNIEDSADKYAHIVGNGESDTSRSNAHTLDWNGNAWFAGDVYIGGTSQDDASAIKLSTLRTELDSKVDSAYVDTAITNAIGNAIAASY